jgi:hypothetical protein
MKFLSLVLSLPPPASLAVIFAAAGDGLAFEDADFAAEAATENPKAIDPIREIIITFFISIVRLRCRIRHLRFACSAALGCKGDATLNHDSKISNKAARDN